MASDTRDVLKVGRIAVSQKAATAAHKAALIVDDMVGHQTDEQRRRYRHLYPDVKQDAIRAVFGNGGR